MNDLKLYGKNDKELDGLLCTVKKFSDDIGMEFCLDKCVKKFSDDIGMEFCLDKCVKKFSDDIGMEFCLDKCAKATFFRGRLTFASQIKLNEDATITELDQGKT